MQVHKPPESRLESQRDSIVSLTIGADGRLYCHDIEPAMMEVLDALCGTDAELEARRVSRTESLPGSGCSAPHALKASTLQMGDGELQ